MLKLRRWESIILKSSSRKLTIISGMGMEGGWGQNARQVKLIDCP